MDPAFVLHVACLALPGIPRKRNVRRKGRASSVRTSKCILSFLKDDQTS